MAVVGEVNKNDIVVRNEEVSPGILALLRKRNAQGARGIYELPVAKPSEPNYYTAAKQKVEDNIRSSARTVNAMAPEGERLAFVNPQEEMILKLLGGAGEPEPVTGIPSYYTPGSGKFGGYSSARYNVDKPGGVRAGERLTMADSPELGGKQASFATDPTSAEAVLKARLAAKESPSLEDRAILAADITGTQMAGAPKTGFEKFLDTIIKGGGIASTALKTVTDSIFGDGDKVAFGAYLDKNPELKEEYDDLSKQQKDYLFEQRDVLMPGYEEFVTQRLQKPDPSRGRDDSTSPATVDMDGDGDIDEDDAELQYFNFARRFIQPMGYEDIIRRATAGQESPLLETLQEAIDRGTA